MKVKRFFEPEPAQWGLRGDKYLWRKLSLLDISGNILDGIKQEISKYFDIDTKDKRIPVAEFAIGGGMSEGWLSPRFWREKGLPLLEQRINQ